MEKTACRSEFSDWSVVLSLCFMHTNVWKQGRFESRTTQWKIFQSTTKIWFVGVFNWDISWQINYILIYKSSVMRSRDVWMRMRSLVTEEGTKTFSTTYRAGQLHVAVCNEDPSQRFVWKDVCLEQHALLAVEGGCERFPARTQYSFNIVQ